MRAAFAAAVARTHAPRAGTRKDWVSHPADLWHHLMGISITSAAMAIPRIAPFIPMFVVVELSTIFLNLMWLLRTAGRADTAMCVAPALARAGNRHAPVE